MGRFETIIIVCVAYVIGQFAIPWVFDLLRLADWLTEIVRYLFIIPIPVIMVKDLKGIPYIRIISIAVFVIPTSSLILNLTVGTAIQQVGGFAVIAMLASIVGVFAVSFVVYHYLNFSKRGAVFMILFAIFTYLQPILGNFPALVGTFFGVVADYSNQSSDVNWNIYGPGGLSTWYTYSVEILAFVFLVLGFDGLMEEKKYSNY